MPDGAAPGLEQLLTFRVADESFALPASRIREVVRPPKLTRVPHAPVCLLGVGNLRGNVLPLVALGALIDRPVTTQGRVIVLEQAEPVGLLVDEVSAVVADGGSARIIDIGPLLDTAFGAHRLPGSGRSGSVGLPERETTAANELVLLAFTIGSQEFALPITQIEEVARLPDDITIMPKADAVVVGTVARAGKLLPLLSLGVLLGLKSTAAGHRQRVVVARIGSQSIGLVVDAIRSVLRVDEEDIDPVPEVLSRGTAEARIQAICRLDGGRRLVSILATDFLLRADLTERLQQQRGEEGGNMAAGILEEDGEQVLIFQIGGQDFAIPISVVSEVTAVPDRFTPLPKAPPFIEGVMNLRGDVIAVIDQRRRFEGEAATGRRRRIIVVALGDMTVGFVVDAVSEVLRVPASAIRAAPALGDDRTRVFDRIANLDGAERMILIVDPQELLDRAERDLIAAITDREGARAS